MKSRRRRRRKNKVGENNGQLRFVRHHGWQPGERSKQVFGAKPPAGVRIRGFKHQENEKTSLNLTKQMQLFPPGNTGHPLSTLPDIITPELNNCTACLVFCLRCCYCSELNMTKEFKSLEKLCWNIHISSLPSSATAKT